MKRKVIQPNVENEKTLAVSPVSKWKAGREGTVVQLPSGMIIRVKQLDLIDCISSDIIPLELFETMQSAISTAQSGQDVSVSQFNKEAMAHLRQTLLKVAAIAVLEPKVVAEESQETDDNIWVGNIPESDLMEIFSASISRGAAFFSSFRTQG
jgi:hypothetical protein